MAGHTAGIGTTLMLLQRLMTCLVRMTEKCDLQPLDVVHMAWARVPQNCQDHL